MFVPLVLVAAMVAAAQPPAALVRKDAHSLSPVGPEIAALRRGVQAMKARQATDPTSWAYQGAMHGTDTPGNNPGWNSCQHGSFFFLSWHRMYLHYFERILRKASGDPTLTLPYWNYSKSGQNMLPLPYMQPADPQQNPLFEPNRNPPVNQGAGLPASATSFSQAMTLTRFTSATAARGFGGRTIGQPAHFTGPHGPIESQPHDIVHVLVGGDSGFMADPNFAALDPIFWAHHANIDRLWESWLARGGGRANPTANSAWMNTDFTFFDENGTQVTMKGSQVLQTAAQLGYRYDALEAPQVPVPTPESPEVPEATPATLVTVSKKTSLGDKTSVSVKLPKTAFPSPGLESAGGGKSFTLHVEGLQSDKSSGGFWEVYLNLPKGAAASHDSPHFIGTVAFFGRKHAHNPSAPSSQDFDITGVVNKLRREGKLKDGKLDVQFVRRTMGGGKSKVEGAPRFDKLRVEAQ